MCASVFAYAMLCMKFQQHRPHNNIRVSRWHSFNFCITSMCYAILIENHPTILLRSYTCLGQFLKLYLLCATGELNVSQFQPTDNNHHTRTHTHTHIHIYCCCKMIKCHQYCWVCVCVRHNKIHSQHFHSTTVRQVKIIAARNHKQLLCFRGDTWPVCM